MLNTHLVELNKDEVDFILACVLVSVASHSSAEDRPVRTFIAGKLFSRSLNALEFAGVDKLTDKLIAMGLEMKNG